ncbi:hypothetical protein Bind_3564 [Beijerinckia indica subsp. indica ATCC 9039]|uniref:Uncharacterized protein n=1 Tax=Beijerinckia indica subsp. indica (strain ATCC 9039 / DSM 1715 / NCIMB 8712) TaxID=395963 RepID=B2IG47_BEII9|nr:hypothetical protein Bind_3564 [Beijerinckia indica subsp. indica ATCC 9039]
MAIRGADARAVPISCYKDLKILNINKSSSFFGSDAPEAIKSILIPYGFVANEEPVNGVSNPDFRANRVHLRNDIW